VFYIYLAWSWPAIVQTCCFNARKNAVPLRLQCIQLIRNTTGCPI